MITYHNPIKHTLRVGKDNYMSTHQALPEGIKDFQLKKKKKRKEDIYNNVWPNVINLFS